MFATLLLVGHVLLGMGIIGLVLIQHGKGADAGAAFGSGASATVFGARGSGSFLTRTTGVFAILFFASSMSLALLARQRAPDTSLLEAPVAEESVMDIPVDEISDPANTQTADTDLPPVVIPEDEESDGQ